MKFNKHALENRDHVKDGKYGQFYSLLKIYLLAQFPDMKCYGPISKASREGEKKNIDFRIKSSDERIGIKCVFKVNQDTDNFRLSLGSHNVPNCILEDTNCTDILFFEEHYDGTKTCYIVVKDDIVMDVESNILSTKATRVDDGIIIPISWIKENAYKTFNILI